MITRWKEMIQSTMGGSGAACIQQFCILITWALGGLVMALLWLSTGVQDASSATDLTVCLAGPPACLYSSVQQAVDAASDGDIIKVATGVYTGVERRPSPSGYSGPSIISQTVYVSKSVTIRGGYALAFTDPPDPEANPTTLDAEGNGRVLFITGSVSPTIEGFRITGGDATGLGGYSASAGYGGGVGTNASSITISDCWIFSNIADYGGGLASWNSDATLIGNKVTANTATTTSVWGGGGGVCFLRGEFTIQGNTISNNTSNGSGGGLGVSVGYLTASRNVISANTARFDGGGLYLNEAPATIEWNTVIGNSAEDGGGLYLWYSEAMLNGNSVLSNAADHGGGLFLWGSDAEATNTVIADNQGGVSGSGLHATSASFLFVHSTIANNWGGDGSGVYVNGDEWWGYGSLDLANTVLLNHTVGIYVRGGNTASLESTLWHGNATNWSGTGAFSHVNDYSGDPAFIDPSSGDYHIGAGSAAIDVGVDAGITVDIDGEARPMGTGYDIGADEFAPLESPTLLPISNPGFDVEYVVTWASVGGAASYSLQEDDDIHFPSPSIRYTGAATHYQILSQPGGTWYYRVRANGPIGGSPWSSTESVSVDGTPPSSSASSPAYDNGGTMPVDWSANDPTPSSGLDQTCLWQKLGEAGTWTAQGGCQPGSSGTFDFEPFGSINGTYYFQSVAQDNVGNVEGGPLGNGDDNTVFDTVSPASEVSSPSASLPGVTISVTWTASDTTSGVHTTCLWYKYGDGSWADASSCQSTESGVFPFLPVFGEGMYSFQSVATDRAGNVEEGPAGAGDAQTLVQQFDVYMPLVLRSHPPPIVTNGGLETGDFTAWTHSGALPQRVAIFEPHEGSYAALLGEEVPAQSQDRSSAWMMQQVELPSQDRPITLSFWYRIFTNDVYDWASFRVVLRDSGGGVVEEVLRDGYPGSYAPPEGTDLGWRHFSFDLSAYRGQTVQLWFENKNEHDGAWGIWSYLDDVQVRQGQ